MFELATKRLLKEVREYEPVNDQETADQKAFISLLKNQKGIWTRDNTMAHLTASAWIVNQNLDKVLMIFHSIYNSWSWTGGHADGETDLLKLAINEAKEETGVETVSALRPKPFALEVLTVDGHYKHGQFVSPHLHYNVTYLLRADDHQLLKHNPNENSDVAWFSLEAAVEASNEPYMRGIYKKLNKKLK